MPNSWRGYYKKSHPAQQSPDECGFAATYGGEPCRLRCVRRLLDTDSAGRHGICARRSGVNLSSLMFDPSTTTVEVGTTVTWRNDEPITHTVTSGRFVGVDETTGLRSSQDPDGTFAAKLPGKGKTFSFTFTEPGNYTYYCDIHQGMNATIMVVANSTQR